MTDEGPPGRRSGSLSRRALLKRTGAAGALFATGGVESAGAQSNCSSEQCPSDGRDLRKWYWEKEYRAYVDTEGDPWEPADEPGRRLAANHRLLYVGAEWNDLDVHSSPECEYDHEELGIQGSWQHRFLLTGQAVSSLTAPDGDGGLEAYPGRGIADNGYTISTEGGCVVPDTAGPESYFVKPDGFEQDLLADGRAPECLAKCKEYGDGVQTFATGLMEQAVVGAISRAASSTWPGLVVSGALLVGKALQAGTPDTNDSYTVEDNRGGSGRSAAGHFVEFTVNVPPGVPGMCTVESRIEADTDKIPEAAIERAGYTSPRWEIVLDSLDPPSERSEPPSANAASAGFRMDYEPCTSLGQPRPELYLEGVDEELPGGRDADSKPPKSTVSIELDEALITSPVRNKPPSSSASFCMDSPHPVFAPGVEQVTHRNDPPTVGIDPLDGTVLGPDETLRFEVIGGDPNGTIQKYDWTVTSYDLGFGGSATLPPAAFSVYSATGPRLELSQPHLVSDVNHLTVTVTVVDEDGFTASSNVHVDLAPGDDPDGSSDRLDPGVAAAKPAEAASDRTRPPTGSGPTAAMAVNAELPPETGEPVTFDAGASNGVDPDSATYRWEFDAIPEPMASPVDVGSTVEHGRTVERAFYVAHRVTLVVTDAAGETDTQSMVIRPGESPLTAIAVSDLAPTAGDTVTFDASRSRAADGSSLSYAWFVGPVNDGATVDVGEGRPGEGGETIERTFDQPGEYRATVVVTDARGLSTTTSRTITVGATWASLRNDAGNAGYAPQADGPTGEVAVRWDREIPNAVGPPAVARDAVYVVTNDGLYALSGRTGAELWATGTGARSFSSVPAVHDGVVYASQDYGVAGYDLTDGSPTVRHSFGGSPPVPSGPVTVAGDTVYALANDRGIEAGTGAYVSAVSASGGNERWQYEPEATGPQYRTLGPVAATDDAVYCQTDTHAVAVDAGSGTERWATRVVPEGEANESVSAPSVVDETVYVASNHSGGATVTALGTGGSREWRTSLSGAVSGCAVAGDSIYLRNDDGGGGAVALSRSSGEVQWRAGGLGAAGFTGGGAFYAPAVTDEAVYFNAGDGGVVALAADDGTERWRFDAAESTPYQPVVAGATVYLVAGEGHVYALESA